MGITRTCREFERATLDLVQMDYKNLRICELGNQFMEELESPEGRGPAKPIYSSWGVQHTSIDLNGLNGALVLDLDRPVPPNMVNRFDLVTNYGTVEHVNNQFQAFKNVHDMVRIGGAMIHTLPPPNSWPNHGRYHYSEEFVTQLARACNYQIVRMEIRDCYSDSRSIMNLKLIMVGLLKTSGTFMHADEFKKLPLIDTGDLTHTGDYSMVLEIESLRFEKNTLTTQLQDLSRNFSQLNQNFELTQSELEEIKRSFSYRFMRFGASIIHRLFPDGTRRGRARQAIVSWLNKPTKSMARTQ